MELGQQYVISLKIICRSKRWKDLLLRNKFEETGFFLVIFWQTYICISSFLIHSDNRSRQWEVA